MGLRHMGLRHMDLRRLDPRRLRLIALTIVLAAANAAVSAQTLNPTTTLTIPHQSEVSVSPVTPNASGGLSGENETTGTNPLTGLPCTGEGSLAISGAGELPDSSSTPADSTPLAPQLPALNSVFGSSTTLGSC